MEYTPDNWVIVKITPKEGETLYKVLAGWSGSYLYGTSWKLNSGITSVAEDGDHYLFHGYSKSSYRCNKKAEGLSLATAGILHHMQEIPNARVEVVSVNDLRETLNEAV